MFNREEGLKNLEKLLKNIAPKTRMNILINI